MKPGLHERLAEAIDARLEGRTFADKVGAFHQKVRDQGVRGVHGTRMTLNRWLEGNGQPPTYWVDLAASILEVPPRWLKVGDGDASLSGGGEPLESEEGAEKAEGSEEGEGDAEEAEEAPGADSEAQDGESGEALPSDEEVWDQNAAVISEYVDGCSDEAVLQAIQGAEVRNPKYEGGRKTVLSAVEDRLEDLREE